MAKSISKKPQESEKNLRFTLFAKTSNISKLDYIAKAESFKQNKDISRTDLVNEAIGDFIAKWEKKNDNISV